MKLQNIRITPLHFAWKQKVSDYIFIAIVTYVPRNDNFGINKNDTEI